MDENDLYELVELLHGKDWQRQRDASEALVAGGDAGRQAVLDRLNHPRPFIRRACLDFLDHYGDTLCFDEVRTLALNDPIPDVRRAAVHALGCVRCKPEPTDASVIDFLAGVARQDPSRKVRVQAVYLLGSQSPNERAAEALAGVLKTETSYDITSAAHRALRHHSPTYRRETDARARELSTKRPS